MFKPKFDRDRVMQYICEMWADPKVTKLEMAERLGVSKGTIDRYAWMLGLADRRAVKPPMQIEIDGKTYDSYLAASIGSGLKISSVKSRVMRSRRKNRCSKQ